jgi:orotidine-5'-phosphate decarboxylase
MSERPLGAERVSAARDRLVLVLDLDDLDRARRLAQRLAPWFGTVKVGYELYGVTGPDAFDALHELGLRVFADLKLHDIPTTVAHGARVLGRRGVEFLNFHASGGVEMLRAGVEGLQEGARDVGHPPPISLGVTVLTSEARADAFPERLAWSRDAGCDGVVCAAREAPEARGAGMRTMVPGIRLPAQPVDDQARVATPDEAIECGADWLVVGRAVINAPDQEAAATEITELVELASRQR